MKRCCLMGAWAPMRGRRAVQLVACARIAVRFATAVRNAHIRRVRVGCEKCAGEQQMDAGWVPEGRERAARLDVGVVVGSDYG